MPAILLIKTSSLGDVVHNLPVVDDIMQHFPNATVDWVVEENFVDIPALHPQVRHVLPVAIRRWRKRWWAADVWNEVAAFREIAQAGAYDCVIDTQGLLKSAWLTWQIDAPRAGYAWRCAREPLASWVYHRRLWVDKNLHAVERNRQLVGQALGYTPPPLVCYGLSIPPLQAAWLPTQPYAVLLHATSRADKEWSPAAWQALQTWLATHHIASILPWGTVAEASHAQLLVQGQTNSVVAPRLSVADAARLLAGARVVVGVDTGLTHLAVAVGVPVIALYVHSQPSLTGVYGGQAPLLSLGTQGHPPALEDVLITLNQWGIVP